MVGDEFQMRAALDLQPDLTASRTRQAHGRLRVLKATAQEGESGLQVVLEIGKPQRRLQADLAMNDGVHHAAGLVEFVDPSTCEVVGRYQVAVDVEAGSGLAALLTVSYAEIGAAFGRELCSRAALIRPAG